MNRGDNMNLSDDLERCPKCGSRNWIDYGDYLECGTCGYDDTDDIMYGDEEETEE